MEDAIRTPLEQLESEAVYLLRETAALFQKPALRAGDNERSRALSELARRAFAPGSLPMGDDDDFDALLCPEAKEGSFEVWPLYGKPPKTNGAWRIFPLASWAPDDIAALLGSSRPEHQRRLMRLCVVGEPGSGKSTVVQGLLACSLEAKGRPGGRHHHLSTPERRFFVIDPPGQEPSSHGLAAAAAAAEVALLVVDAQQGLTTTCKRQAFLLALMGIPHLVVVVNKMDLIDFSRQAYEKIVADFETLASLIEVKNLSFIPVAAESFHNLAQPSVAMPWNQGAPLFGHLDSVTPGSLRNMTDFRLPVQWAQVDQQRQSAFVGGRMASGRVSVGDKVVVLPTGQETNVVNIRRSESDHTVAFAGDSVTLELGPTDPPIQGGDLIATTESLPNRSSELEAVVLWLDDEPQRPETTYTLHHATRLVSAHIPDVLACLHAETLTWGPGEPLSKGAIGKVRVTTAAPLYFDSYTANRQTGAFALLHSQTRAVLGAGILRGPALELSDVTASAERLKSALVVEDPTLVTREERVRSYGHKAAVLWFTGLSGSGKSTVAKAVEKRLYERGHHTLFLDGDNVRSGLNGDLGFTEEARTESTRRVAELAALAFEQGQIVVCSFISGSSDDRAFVRSLIPEGHFFECFVNCPIDVCRSRDPKDLYKKADAGELLSFSGISIPYDEPQNPHLELRSDEHDVDVLADRVMELLKEHAVTV